MLSSNLMKGFDGKRLKKLLTVFFVALAVPTAVLIWHTYSQLKWESFHRYRGVAEELTARIDGRLVDMINTADARLFADYTFLVVTGDSSANFLQRSPLSAYPLTQDIAGVTGYFQVDASGNFSTPLLPPEGSQIERLGMDTDEYTARFQLAQEIGSVLADNRLTRSRPDSRSRRVLLPASVPPKVKTSEDKDAGGEDPPGLGTRSQAAADEAAIVASSDMADFSVEMRRDTVNQPEAILEDSEVMAMPVDEPAAADRQDALNPAPLEPDPADTYRQDVFDELAKSRSVDGSLEESIGSSRQEDDAANEAQAPRPYNSAGKVAELKLDSSLQKKSESAEREQEGSFAKESGRFNSPARKAVVTRREQSALPESGAASGAPLLAGALSTSNLRISTFESEIDPFEFSMLDSGHLVLFRKVWLNGERFIQGMLIDREEFLDDIVYSQFAGTSLGTVSNLIVANQDDVIYTVNAHDVNSYPNGNEALAGALLYRARLSAPVDQLELIFSITRLPPGPGAAVLGWVTLVLGIVFSGGFFALYRLGSTQIELVRQQQDFVSAVSHELKTPLTSIRMYGEMLKEGWADDAKRQSYYEFIHDESERLTRLISNVLQLARITRNEPQFDMKPTRVSELISNIESKISTQLARAGFELVLSGDDTAGQKSIDIDDDCFTQIIINLVDNAIKFSRNGSKKIIEIGCKQNADKHIVFSIRDYGPGIPKDQLKKIFTLFYRSESELTRETVGTGIGLAIVHQLSTAMGGQVDVVNREPGVEFRISFPVL